MKDLLVVTACGWKDTSPMFRLMESCKFYGYDLQYYGVGTSGYKNFRQLKVKELCDFLVTVIEDYKYILFTDGFDSWMVNTPEYTINTFESFNADIVVSANNECYPNSDIGVFFKDFPNNNPFKYICAGQFMGKSKDLLSFLHRMYIKYQDVTNDQEMWALGYLEKITESFIVIDHTMKLFGNATAIENMGGANSCRSKGWLNLLGTGSFHFGGGKGGSPLEIKMDETYRNWLKVREDLL